MADERPPLELQGTIHLMTVSPTDGGRWEYFVELFPQSNALLTSSDADRLAEYLRPGGGRSMVVTEGQVERAVEAIHVPMMRADIEDRDIVERVLKALGIEIFDAEQPAQGPE